MIKEKKISKMIVASARHYVENISDELIEQFTNDFEVQLAKTGVVRSESQNFFTVFHVDAYRDNNYEMELWVQIDTTKQNTDLITFKTIPENEVAYIVVTEDYENLQLSYDALYNYARENGYEVNGYPRETYHFDVSAPLGYYTEIQLPFTRKTT